MAKVRTHKANLERSRVGMSVEQIHKAKCAKKHAVREAQREENLKKEKERKRLSPQEQLKKLDFRLGEGMGAVKERKKIAEKLKK